MADDTTTEPTPESAPNTTELTLELGQGVDFLHNLSAKAPAPLETHALAARIATAIKARLAVADELEAKAKTPTRTPRGSKRT